ncbi:hypothetical protein [Thalassotalea piscium]|uniref:Uncharacterized protein n=1 Tax=Thalassotalea piscium TaxID=1230533 RepID=A0A7X0NIT5_9GAMM|nr:hypothetical protein [Thalassotalea piscium]MBB6544234.1 hypothetical protein [Thalassotalea piscium]
MLKPMPLLNQVIHYGRYLLIFSFIGFISCLLISYPYAEYFSIGVQVSAHILTIVLAGIFKLTVVALMAATKELNADSASTKAKDVYATA